MKLLALAASILMPLSAFGEETIQNILNTKTAPATVHLVRDSIKRVKGVACTAMVIIENANELTSLTNSQFQSTVKIGMDRYCGEAPGLDIEKTLALFSAADEAKGTAKSQLSELIYVMPENQSGGPDAVLCERQIVETLDITLANGAVIHGNGNGYNIPGKPSMETCRGLRQQTGQ